MLFSENNDRIIKQAFEMYYEDFFKTFATPEELASITFSKKFEKRMDKLIRRAKKPYYKMINTVGKRVAMIALAVILSLTVVTFSVEAIREPVVNFIVETFEKFSRIVFDNEETKVVEFVKTEPTYIPEGFEVESTEGDIDWYKILYKNPAGLIIHYSQYKNTNSQTYINTEDITYKNVSIKGFDGVVYENSGEIHAVFSNQHSVFVVTVPDAITQEELIKIAESIPI